MKKSKGAQMKKWMIAVLAGLLTVSLAVPVMADTLPETDPGWYVTLNTAGKMESNFTTGQMDEIIADMQPGDEAVFRIAVNNDYNDSIDWYMANDVLYSMEDRSANQGTTGGGYSYLLTYTGTDGKAQTLFDSDTLGGDTTDEAGAGLNEATDSLDDWFLLEKMGAGTKGQVELHIVLDGETQGNNYQDTLADLQFNFAAEFPETENETTKPKETTPGKEPKTGDTNNLILYIILMAAAAVLAVAAFVIAGVSRRRKAEEAEGTGEAGAMTKGGGTPEDENRRAGK